MWTVDELKERNETLNVQLRLALASPLWKGLPYGAQINPRAWRIEVLALRPGRRLYAWITVPWKTAQAQAAGGLQFAALVWHNQLGGAVHRTLARFNERREASGQAERRMMFYDALSHAFIVQCGWSEKAGGAVAGGARMPDFRRQWAGRAARCVRRKWRGWRDGSEE